MSEIDNNPAEVNFHKAMTGIEGHVEAARLMSRIAINAGSDANEMRAKVWDTIASLMNLEKKLSEHQ